MSICCEAPLNLISPCANICSYLSMCEYLPLSHPVSASSPSIQHPSFSVLPTFSIHFLCVHSSHFFNLRFFILFFLAFPPSFFFFIFLFHHLTGLLFSPPHLFPLPLSEVIHFLPMPDLWWQGEKWDRGNERERQGKKKHMKKKHLKAGVGGQCLKIGWKYSCWLAEDCNADNPASVSVRISKSKCVSTFFAALLPLQHFSFHNTSDLFYGL